MSNDTCLRVLKETRWTKDDLALAAMGRACEASRVAIHRTAQAAAQDRFVDLAALRRFLLEALATEYRKRCLPDDPPPDDQHPQWLAYPPIVTVGGPPLGTRGIDRVHPKAFANAPLVVPSGSEGTYVLVDAGVRIGGYCSDVTRTFRGTSRDPPSAHQDVHRLVDRMYTAAAALVRPGTTWGDVERAARRVMRKGLASLAVYDPRGPETPRAEEPTTMGTHAHTGNWDAYMPHELGHTVGLQVHDQPALTATTQLRPGMVLTIEPGVYTTSVSVRLENTLCVTPQGFRTM